MNNSEAGNVYWIILLVGGKLVWKQLAFATLIFLVKVGPRPQVFC